MTKRTSLRIPIALWTWLLERAKREGRTMSNLIVHLLEQARTKEQEDVGKQPK